MLLQLSMVEKCPRRILVLSNYLNGRFLIFQNLIAFCSFFLENDSLGLSRAQVATQVLLELNPDVRGDYIDESPEQLLNHNPDFFSSFTLVVATSLPEKYSN